MLTKLRGLWLLRTIARELGGIRTQLARQTDLLERLAAAYTPAPATHTPAADPIETGISFLDAIDAGLVEDYSERTRRDTGREPTEAEVLSYLADEKTLDLQIRLKERAAALQLARLGGATSTRETG